MRGRMLLPLLLLLGADAPDDPLDLTRAYPKGAAVRLACRLSVHDLLERDPWSLGQWKTCREQTMEWTATFACTVRDASAKGIAFQAVLQDLAGTWSDDSPDDAQKPEVQVTFPVPAGGKPGPWAAALAELRGTEIRFQVGPRGGVSALSGMAAAFQKRFQGLLADRATKPLAQDLSGWFSDETWSALLSEALPSCPPKEASWKAPQAYPFPWSREFAEQALSKVTVAHSFERAEGEVTVLASVNSGKVDETLQWIGQPGFHCLGTQQKLVGESVFAQAPLGLRSTKAAWTVQDRWDNYRPSSKADRFDRHVTASFEVQVGTGSR